MKINHKLEPKFNFSAEYVRSVLPKSGGFGFLFHATDWSTISFAYKNINERSPELEKALWQEKPFIASFIKIGDQPVGVNIAMPVPIDVWIGTSRGVREFREKQFFPALEFAASCNLKMIAMGASTPYVCNYGKLPRPLSNPFITTGHAATAATLKKWAVYACEQTGCDYEKIKLAIFGAAGRLGKAVSQFIAYSSPPKEIVLIDLKDKMSLLKTQAEEMLKINNRKDLKISIYCFEEGTELPQFDGAILVSNNSVPYLTEHDLKKARFWIDDSHPRAASVEAEIASRKDTLYVECYARGPEGFDTDFPFRLPTMQDCYTCCAEGYVAWREEIQEDFVTGIPDVEKISLVDKLLDKYAFNLGPFAAKNGEKISQIPNYASLKQDSQIVLNRDLSKRLEEVVDVKTNPIIIGVTKTQPQIVKVDFGTKFIATKNEINIQSEVEVKDSNIESHVTKTNVKTFGNVVN